jgi:hypothetical protein
MPFFDQRVRVEGSGQDRLRSSIGSILHPNPAPATKIRLVFLRLGTSTRLTSRSPAKVVKQFLVFRNDSDGFFRFGMRRGVTARVPCRPQHASARWRPARRAPATVTRALAFSPWWTIFIYAHVVDKVGIRNVD